MSIANIGTYPNSLFNTLAESLTTAKSSQNKLSNSYSWGMCKVTAVSDDFETFDLTFLDNTSISRKGSLGTDHYFNMKNEPPQIGDSLLVLHSNYHEIMIVARLNPMMPNDPMFGGAASLTSSAVPGAVTNCC